MGIGTRRRSDALFAVVMALALPAAALAAFPGTDPSESPRVNTPNDPDFDHCEADDPDTSPPRCSTYFDEPGGSQTYTIPGRAMRFVAIRAVDEQGNVGRPLVVDVGVRQSASASDSRPSSSEAARQSSRTPEASGSPDPPPASCSSPSPPRPPAAAGPPPADTSQALRRSPETGTYARRSRAPAAP